MRKKKNNAVAIDNDTIAAIATPAGSGGVGIIRISGPKALEILGQTFLPQNPKSKPIPYLLRFGRIVNPKDNQELDEVLAVYMPGPRSFTGEEMVEIYCHAGQFTLKSILDNILTCDCRPAEAGEFSLRRFVNRGVDLTMLEGAAEVVAAKTELAYKISREHLMGAYGEKISVIRQMIVHLLAEIEADIDFPEEKDVGSVGRRLLNERLGGIISELEHLSDSYRTGRIIQDGFRVVILGPPNAGKSSLFNYLVRQNRALVTPVPGTTRDYISEWIDIGGLPVELYDTAGLREGRGRVEKAGIEGTRRLIARADLILYLFDFKGKAYGPPDIQLRKEQTLLVVLNKMDLLSSIVSRAKAWMHILGDRFSFYIISAKTGAGVPQLIKKILMIAGTADLTDSIIVTSHRHKVKIDKCLTHLRRIRRMKAQPSELISLELRQAADQIAEITGQIYTEEILGEIFSNFCIGK